MDKNEFYLSYVGVFVKRVACLASDCLRIHRTQNVRVWNATVSFSSVLAIALLPSL